MKNRFYIVIPVLLFLLLMLYPQYGEKRGVERENRLAQEAQTPISSTNTEHFSQPRQVKRTGNDYSFLNDFIALEQFWKDNMEMTTAHVDFFSLSAADYINIYQRLDDDPHINFFIQYLAQYCRSIQNDQKLVSRLAYAKANDKWRCQSFLESSEYEDYQVEGLFDAMFDVLMPGKNLQSSIAELDIPKDRASLYDELYLGDAEQAKDNIILLESLANIDSIADLQIAVMPLYWQLTTNNSELKEEIAAWYLASCASGSQCTNEMYIGSEFICGAYCWGSSPEEVVRNLAPEQSIQSIVNRAREISRLIVEGNKTQLVCSFAARIHSENTNQCSN